MYEFTNGFIAYDPDLVKQLINAGYTLKTKDNDTKETKIVDENNNNKSTIKGKSEQGNKAIKRV